MHANNETGVVQPISEIAALLTGHPAYFHVDAAQSFGKLIPDLQNSRVDLISISGHKIHAPKGVGALIVRRRGYERVPLEPLMHGGGQERGLRPGTLPVPLVVGLGLAAELAMKENAQRVDYCSKFKQKAVAALNPLGCVITGEGANTLPTTLHLSFPDIDSEALMLALKDEIAISNGSACTSQSYSPSHVLTAMRFSEERIRGAVRLSWCHMTPDPDWPAISTKIRQLLH